MLKRTPRSGSALVGIALLCIAAPPPARAQTATVRVERENFRAAPRGIVIAEVLSGTTVALGEARERWRESTLDGWIWARSVRAEAAGDHDLVVSARAGENLRVAPNGTIAARLREGARLRRVESRGDWIRVRRTGWLWEPSLTIASGAEPVRVTAGRSDPPSPGAVPASAAREFTTAGRAGLVVMDRAGADTLARVRPGSAIEVLAREGDWSRVRVEGWVVTASIMQDTADDAVLRDIATEAMQEQPDRFRGRLVEWDGQFIALQQAERFRTEFLEGEYFVLARGPAEEPGFLYIAVPAERLEEARRLSPLQHFRMLGRIRTARSALTGAPVVDLLELRPRAR